MILLNTRTGIKKANIGTVKTSLNKFKGWYCGAGMDFLWINDKGYIFGNVCRHSGCYGNLYTEFTLPTEPMICPASSCYCAADIDILKAKTQSDFTEFAANITNSDLFYIDDYNNQEVISLCGVSKTNQNKFFSINWNIGKRCNYSCTYCPPAVHDNFSPHMPFDTFKKAINKIQESISHKKIQITFTGGEPTINPNFFKIVDYCVNLGIKVFTNTNGTCTVKKMYKLIQAGGAMVSVHAEFAQQKKLVGKIQEVLLYNLSGNLNVKYMLAPGKLEECKQFISILPPRTSKFKFSIEPLVDKINDRTMLIYSLEEIKIIQETQ